MAELGMQTQHLPDGTVRGVLPGAAPEAKPLLLGSHLDTVTNAGKYDGALGLIAALAALEELRDQGIQLPFPVHLLGFSDEEGVRFQTTYLGSRGVTGQLDLETRARLDAAGQSQSLVLATEGWHEDASNIHYVAGSVRGYVELHIEQGRSLEEFDEAACVVSGINGQSRLLVTLTGRADHAGTTPMEFRRDSLTGAAEAILATEKLARDHPGLVATVGKIEVLPGGSNSIPEVTSFTLDFRHAVDAERVRLLKALENSVRKITASRELELNWQLVQENDAVVCDAELARNLCDALERVTGSRRQLASGAGHDGVAISKVAPIGMIFVRCRGGLSHHPDEYVSPADIGVGIRVLVEFLKSLPA
jgi:allantoate deiminase